MARRALSKKFFTAWLAFTLVGPSLTHAQQAPKPSPTAIDDQSWVLTKTHGMKFYKPSDIFSGKVLFADIPEAEYINTEGTQDHNLQMRKILYFLESQGIALGLGVNANRDSFFDLYAPFVDILLDEPAAEFGQTRESEVGKMHFLTHDSTHLKMGMPGPRLSDLKDKPAAKEKLKKILMHEEALASAWTSINHAKWYWKWRYVQDGGTNLEQFDKYNKGLASIGNFAPRDYTNLLEGYMSGRFWDMQKVYKKSIDYDTFAAAREAGVPMLFPSFKNTLTATGEKFLVSKMFQFLLPHVHMTDKKFGFKSLWDYADLQAEFYLSDWYVKWADAFQVGEPLDQLTESLKSQAEEFKQGKVFGDTKKPHPGTFEVMYVRNNLTQFGRKLIELEVLGEKENLNITAQQKAELKRLISQAQSVNEHILKIKSENRPVSPAEITWATDSFRLLMDKANNALPIEKIVPRYLRQAHGDYRTFWFDTFAVLLPRPEGLTKFLSAKGIWAEAQKQRLQRAIARRKGKPVPTVDLQASPVVVADLEKQLAARYNDSRRGEVVQEQTLSANFYINKLLNYNKTIQVQIKDVFIPQLLEHTQLNSGERRDIVQQAERFADIFSRRTQEFAADYEKIFVEYERNAEVMERLVNTESDLKWAVDRVLNGMADSLDLLDEGKQGKHIAKNMAALMDITTKLENRQPVTRGLKDILRNILPFKKDNVKMVCSLITRLCLKNEKLNTFFDKMPLGPLAGDKANKAVIKHVDAQGRETAPHSLPKDAIIVLALNHEHALMDLASMKNVAKSLQADTVSVLTNKDVWPIYNVRTNTDETIIFKQEKNIKQRVMDLIKKTTGRFLFAIYPEGDLPFFAANFPLPTHLGAFSIARNAAIAHRGNRPVYLIKALGNFQAATNAQGKRAFALEVLPPELVPSEDIVGRDKWIETKRAEFEKQSLEKRGSDQLDLINREKFAGSRVRGVAPVAVYNSAGKFMTDFIKMDGRTVNSCKKVLLD
ncbi:MAG: hypothetical protein HUU57_16505 [Bdellovibrio sp.]|nr:hypothetical protein [Bdellovibrio sp.]